MSGAYTKPAAILDDTFNKQNYSTKFMNLLPSKTQRSCYKREAQTGNKSQRLLDAELEILIALGWDCEQ